MSGYIDSFKKRGFCTQDNLVNNEEICLIMERLENLVNYAIEENNIDLNKESSLDKKLVHLYQNYPNVAGSVYDAINMSLHVNSAFNGKDLRSAIADLVGTGEEDLIIGNIQFFIKPKNTEHYLGWHQDSSYFADFDPDSSLVCWIPLVDVDSSNGALWVVPGSHKLGKLEYVENERGRHKEMEWNKRGLTYIDKKYFDDSEKIQIEVKKGQVAFFDFNLVHKSGLQTASEVRYTMLARFGSAKNKIKYVGG